MCSPQPLWYFRADSRFAPSQWEASLQSNAASHWLGANLESALVFAQEPRGRDSIYKWFMNSWYNLVRFILALTISVMIHLNHNIAHAGIILVMGSANERRRYIVTPPLIGWARTQNEPWHIWQLSCVTCANLWSGLITFPKTATKIPMFTKFWLWAHKPICKMGPRDLIQYKDLVLSVKVSNRE